MTDSEKVNIPENFKKKETEKPKITKKKKINKVRERKVFVLKKGNVLFEKKKNKLIKVGDKIGS